MVLSTHLPAKYVFLRVMKRSKHLNSSSWQHWAVWLSCVGGCTLFSFIIAEVCHSSFRYRCYGRQHGDKGTDLLMNRRIFAA